MKVVANRVLYNVRMEILHSAGPGNILTAKTRLIASVGGIGERGAEGLVGRRNDASMWMDMEAYDAICESDLSES